MISFSRASEKDAQLLLDAKIKAFAWDVNTYGMGPQGYDSLEDLTNAINKAYYYKILYDNIIVGGFSLYKLSEDHFELGSIYVGPEYQNKGIGSETLNFIEQSFPEVKKWILDTPYLSFRNHHFYEKMGYVKVGEFNPEADKEFKLFKYEKNI